MKAAAPSLAPILRSDTQGRILARLLTDPEKSYNLSELAELANSSMPTVQREVGRAEDAGIVTTEKVGPARLVRANPNHPLFAPLSQLLLSTYGPPAVIATEFQDIDDTQAVVLFGSWAARYLGQPGRAPNDIDVLVIGTPDRDAMAPRNALSASSGSRCRPRCDRCRNGLPGGTASSKRSRAGRWSWCSPPTT